MSGESSSSRSGRKGRETGSLSRRLAPRAGRSGQAAGQAGPGRKPTLASYVRLTAQVALAVKAASPACISFEGGARDADGYGMVSVAGRSVRAHRVAFEAAFGFMPALVRHSCDVRDCIQPHHLLAGTQAQNVRDTEERGRANHGARRLTAEEVAVIRRALATGTISRRQIAREYRRAKNTIDSIANWSTWREVDAAEAVSA